MRTSTLAAFWAAACLCFGMPVASAQSRCRQRRPTLRNRGKDSGRCEVGARISRRRISRSSRCHSRKRWFRAHICGRARRSRQSR